MRRRTLLALLLAFGALLGAATYIGWTGPSVNSALGLVRFNETRTRHLVQELAQNLLGTQGAVPLALDLEIDEDSLRRMHRLYGVVAANHWASKEVSILKWSYSVVPADAKPLALGEEKPSPLVITVGSAGAIQSIERFLDKKTMPALPTTFDQGRELALSLLRIVGVSEDRLILTGTKTSESEGTSIFEFTWKESLDGLPGLLYEYAVTIKSGYITSFKRTPVFSGQEEQGGWAQNLAPLGSGVAWCFLALMTLILFIQELRKDQVDMVHARQVALISAALSLGYFLANPQGNFLRALLGGVVLAVVMVLCFGFLWIVSESLLRSSAPEKLRHMDLLLSGRWNIREVGRDAVWAWGIGFLFLLAPTATLWAALRWRSLGISILPPEMRLESLSFPGGLVGDALLGPVPIVVLLGTVLLGVLFPLLKLRFRKGWALALFCLVFVLAATPLLAGSIHPWTLPALSCLVVGAVLFFVMDSCGLFCALLVLYVPLATRNISLLLDAKQPAIYYQGWGALAVFLCMFACTAAVAAFGRSHVKIRDYEPDYLRRMRERERFARELEIAKGIQQRFLPKVMPEIPGFKLAAACVPAMEVGGDIYDVLPMGGGRWLLLIGDVSGKGVRAAFYMTLAKGILHAVASMEHSHREILRRLNGTLKHLTDEGVFLTLCAVVLDPKAGHAQIISAGHNPPLLRRGGGIKILEPKGIVLGIVDEDLFLASLKDIHLEIQEGDTLILYTDGVTESMNREEDQFGLESLVARVAEAPDFPPEALVRRIIDSVEAFEEGAPQADDLTLLVIQASNLDFARQEDFEDRGEA